MRSPFLCSVVGKTLHDITGFARKSHAHCAELTTTTTDVAAAGIRLAVVGENLALASSAPAAVDAMLASPTGLSQFAISAYDRTGISVVEGPTGRLVVIVLGG